MNSIVIKNGLMAAGAAIILGLVVYLIDPKGFLSWGSWLTLIPILYFMVSAVKETRNENGGFISLRQAFTPAWITYLFYAVLSSLFSYILMNFIDPDLIVMAKEVSIEAIEKMSGILGEDGVQAAIEKIENENPFGIQQTLMGIAITLVFPGALIALIIAAIMKKTNPEEMA
ncbi:MAG TPA: DUF4199 domain-containing protein [Saprospiraceae bacterium]|nr:DUF4199 domain-containing protein [Saprospiraceae bacterium]